MLPSKVGRGKIQRFFNFRAKVLEPNWSIWTFLSIKEFFHIRLLLSELKHLNIFSPPLSKLIYRTKVGKGVFIWRRASPPRRSSKWIKPVL